MQLSTVNWGSVADWVSGLGALSAAAVALYLARAAERIKLRGFCGLRMLIGQGTQPEELVFISVTNVGTRATVINNISMRVGKWKKRYAVITVVKDPYSVGVPYALADGQEGHWGIPLRNNREWLRELVSGFVESERDVKSLRFFVHTNHGQNICLRPERPLCEAILALLRDEASNPSIERTGAGKPASAAHVER